MPAPKNDDLRFYTKEMVARFKKSSFLTSNVVEPHVQQTTANDYDSMTVAQLSDELGKRGLPTSGSKADLVTRLRENDGSTTQAP
jgi:hypothetical protein